ncbi:MAG: HTTM domain-containing protein [Myxococcaceae bacterium]
MLGAHTLPQRPGPVSQPARELPEPGAPARLLPISGLRSRAAAVLGLDLRSLALFRVALSLVILGDLVQRAVDLRAHYSDAGVLPRAALIERFSGDWAVSLHLASGRVEVQAFLFALHAAAALCLLVGLRTRLATVCCWVLCCSLHARNPMVLQGGDDLLRALLFWSLFLPLGARASVDALARGPARWWTPSSPVLNAGTVALLAQVCAVYWCTAAYKAHPAWTSTGNAVYLALNIDQMSRPLGQVLLHQSWLLRPLSLGTFWLEVLGPLLLLVPILGGRLRALAVAFFLLFHTGLGLTLQLGVFPFVCGAAWLAFLPGLVWQRVPWRRIRHRRLPGILRSGLERLTRLAAAPPPADAVALPPLVSVLVLGLLATVLVWNIAGLFPGRLVRGDRLERFIWTLRLEQSWRMFAPYPLTDDGWYVLPGRLRNGREVDVLTGEAPTWSKPAEVSAMYPNDRWRKYMMNLWSRNNADHRVYLARYLCREWNAGRSPSEQLVTFDMTFMLEPTVEPGRVPTVRKVALWEHRCFSPADARGAVATAPSR